MNTHFSLRNLAGDILRKQFGFITIAFALNANFCNSHACSTVCLDKNGQLILGNNMDWILGDGMVVINKRNVVKSGFWYTNQPAWTWTSKYGSVSLSTEGREFPIRGMNEAGLVVVEMMLSETEHPPAGGLPVLSGSQWIQYQLDTSATVDDVLASDKTVRIEATDWAGMGSHFLICDKSGKIAGIEWLGGKRIIYTGDKLPIPVMVNSAYASCLADQDDLSGRFKPMADMYAAYDATKTSNAVSYVFAMLDTAADKLPPPMATRWRMAFDVPALRMYWKTSENSQLRYLDLKDFDFSCGTDVLVLDINSPGSGNARAAFVPYTSDFNRRLVERTYGIYNQHSPILGKSYSQEMIQGIIAYPETTLCKDKE